MRIACRSLGPELRLSRRPLHFGQEGVSGGIIVFLCANTFDPPTGVPQCPTPRGKVTGTLTSQNVVGPAGQGIAPEDFQAALEAIRSGRACVNVHTVRYPMGEIRGQLD